MSLAKRRRTQGFTQEGFAHAMGVDRRTAGRWEKGTAKPQPHQRPKMAALLRMDLEDLDALLDADAAGGPSPSAWHSPEDMDEMIRREFLRLMTVSSALVGGLDAPQGDADGFDLMNRHLWQVYQLARAKQSVLPAVRAQLSTMNDALSEGGVPLSPFCVAAADLYQEAGGPAVLAPSGGKSGHVRPTSWPLGVSEPVNQQDAGDLLVRRSEVLPRARVSASSAVRVPAGRPDRVASGRSRSWTWSMNAAPGSTSARRT
ncbi:helix-turn-helix transcriptional regulator [Streptomyces acidiscabies]|uniref:Helix-turn-helix transcriptional regulator n=2 Tax=Streptomyces acidiscabies TaxID=42234 RepID=A0AAP6BJC0_9ACTN|nr:helix-turn-helix transcriptional regulator [Streptomyces acidiscabies]MBP5938667.1 helix-turn-helix transcriptional regulator [Streptomyces sp. LBUM 1476]MBZ3909770.1 helix-turn-helix transcriptional regulator [Streptomyces acidiscabies]MDX2965799.1 helix-turn-helix transcriptional regulator [Streptomyces acidiscabies]MDX3025239.1 helix-turn-helix transcriptional regulator [Streptomyces acidiscabies]MDX3795635.1 helix-turn-helix transcriptional regulator [Streptomyces acidiscabies]